MRASSGGPGHSPVPATAHSATPGSPRRPPPGRASVAASRVRSFGAAHWHESRPNQRRCRKCVVKQDEAQQEQYLTAPGRPIAGHHLAPLPRGPDPRTEVHNECRWASARDDRRGGTADAADTPRGSGRAGHEPSPLQRHVPPHVRASTRASCGSTRCATRSAGRKTRPAGRGRWRRRRSCRGAMRGRGPPSFRQASNDCLLGGLPGWTRSERQVARPRDARIGGRSRREVSFRRDDCGSSWVSHKPRSVRAD